MGALAVAMEGFGRRGRWSTVLLRPVGDCVVDDVVSAAVLAERMTTMSGLVERERESDEIRLLYNEKRRCRCSDGHWPRNGTYEMPAVVSATTSRSGWGESHSPIADITHAETDTSRGG